MHHCPLHGLKLLSAQIGAMDAVTAGRGGLVARQPASATSTTAAMKISSGGVRLRRNQAFGVDMSGSLSMSGAYFKLFEFAIGGDKII
jgi:hypothetical protein